MQLRRPPSSPWRAAAPPTFASLAAPATLAVLANSYFDVPLHRRLLHVMAGIEVQAPATPVAAGLAAAGGAPPILLNPPTAEETRVAFDLADPELLFVFDGVSLPIEVQAKILHLGYREVALFTKIDLGDGVKGAKTFAVEDLQLQVQNNPGGRVAVAKVMTAWEMASKRLASRQDEEAKSATLVGMSSGFSSKPVHKSEFLELGRHLEKVVGERESYELPAKAYYEMRLQQVEEGEWKAETLRQVLSQDEDGDTEPWGNLTVTPGGELRARRVSKEVPLPADPEALRYRYRLMALHWEHIRMKFPSRPALVGYNPDIWARHVEWLLSPEIAKSSIRDRAHGFSISPSWELVLEYEYVLRKRAMKLLNDFPNLSLGDALRRAKEDDRLFQRHFITPSSQEASIVAAQGVRQSPAQSSSSRPASSAMPPPPQRQPNGAGVKKPRKRKRGPAPKAASQPRKGGKGGGKSAGKTATTPDGRQKCFDYQRGKCTGFTCPNGRVHVCIYCDGAHPGSECTQRPQ